MPLGAVHDFCLLPVCCMAVSGPRNNGFSFLSLKMGWLGGTNLLAGALCKINRGACCSHTMCRAACFPLSFARGGGNDGHIRHNGHIRHDRQ